MTVYLRYLIAGTASTNDLAVLDAEANNSTTYSSIARSLLCYIAGDCRYPTIEKNPIQPRSSKPKKLVGEAKVYPSVTQDKLFIEHINSGTVQIYDITGTLQYWQDVEDGATIDVSILKSGMYILRYADNTTLEVTSKKIIKI